MITVRQRRLPGMDEPVAELAAYFRSGLPTAGGMSSPPHAASRPVKTWPARLIYRITGETGAALLFSATQEAVWQLTGSERRCPPLTWACPGCALQVTDRTPAGRPVPVEHGHARAAPGWPATRPPR